MFVHIVIQFPTAFSNPIIWLPADIGNLFVIVLADLRNSFCCNSTWGFLNALNIQYLSFVNTSGYQKYQADVICFHHSAKEKLNNLERDNVTRLFVSFFSSNNFSWFHQTPLGRILILSNIRGDFRIRNRLLGIFTHVES